MILKRKHLKHLDVSKTHFFLFSLPKSIFHLCCLQNYESEITIKQYREMWNLFFETAIVEQAPNSIKTGNIYLQELRFYLFISIKSHAILKLKQT